LSFKKMSIWLLVTFIFLTIAGCGGQDPVQKDLLNYVNNEMPKVDDLESNALSGYNSVTGNNYTDDSEMYRVLTDSVIPTYRTFTQKLEEIKPQTPEVQAIHEIYIEAVNNQYNGMVQLSAACENQDTNLVAQANEKLDKGRKGIRDFQSKLDELSKKHGVQMKK
jgi:PBP1b-binding outer membrane lipoprotein LpoB